MFQVQLIFSCSIGLVSFLEASYWNCDSLCHGCILVIITSFTWWRFSIYKYLFVLCCYSVAKSCPTACDPINCRMPNFPVLHSLSKFAQTHDHWDSDAIQRLILSHPLILLPSIFPRIRVFSCELVLCVRWPKYWSFSFSISTSNEYSGLISFKIDWFDLFAVQGTLKSLL